MKNINILPVVILTYRRPQYLQRTISTFIRQNKGKLGMFSLRLLVQGGLDQGTAAVIKQWERHIDFVDVREKNVGAAQGYNICMKEALDLKTTYLLHLQDDWESREPLSKYIPEIFNLMNTNKTIGCIRLRSIHNVRPNVSKRNIISKAGIKWSRGTKNILVGNAHFTLNPTILHRGVVERMIPIKKEHHAQQKFHKLGLQAAQLDASCFWHIGHKRMVGWKR